MAGDRKTGVAVMCMDETLDTGPVALTECVPIGPERRPASCTTNCLCLERPSWPARLDLLARDALTFALQSETGIIYAEKISKAEALIDWVA